MKKSLQLFTIIAILALVIPSFAFGQITGAFGDDNAVNTFVHLEGQSVPPSPVTTVTVGTFVVTVDQHFEDPPR